MSRYLVNVWLSSSVQGDHFSENPENVTEFVSCQGKVRELTKTRENIGNCQGKILSGKNLVRENCLLLTSCLGQHSLY